jgi:hypothetical protein
MTVSNFTPTGADGVLRVLPLGGVGEIDDGRSVVECGVPGEFEREPCFADTAQADEGDRRCVEQCGVDVFQEFAATDERVPRSTTLRWRRQGWLVAR